MWKSFWYDKNTIKKNCYDRINAFENHLFLFYPVNTMEIHFVLRRVFCLMVLFWFSMDATNSIQLYFHLKRDFILLLFLFIYLLFLFLVCITFIQFIHCICYFNWSITVLLWFPIHTTKKKSECQKKLMKKKFRFQMAIFKMLTDCDNGSSTNILSFCLDTKWK